MKVLVILASMLTVTMAIVTGYTREGVVRCLDTGANYQMEFTLTPNNDIADVNYIVAWNGSSNGLWDASYYAECGSNQTNFYTFNATGQNEFQIVINVDKMSLLADKPCGHTNDGLDFLWTFRTAKVEYAILPSFDIWYEVPCNFSRATLTQITQGKAITGDFNPFVAPDTSHSFMLEVTNAANTPVTMVNLGDLVKLQLTEIGEIGGDPTGVSGFSCSAGNNEAFDKQFILLDNLGCPNDLSFITTGFSDVTPLFSLIQARTAQFPQFRFTGSNTIYYKCKVHICVNGVNYLCGDLCSRGGPTGRKRREADDGQIIETSTRITIVSFPVSYAPVATGEDDSAPEQVPNCLSNTGIIASFASLGVLLLVTIATAVFVCIRSSRLLSDSQGHSGWSDKLKL